MRVAGILQPGYLPWLGFFDQLFRSDVFVIYDDVQYDKNGWRNRNRIKTPQGPLWLTVPVLTKGKSGQLVCETMINNNENWRVKHLNAIQSNYAKAPFFKQCFPAFEETLMKKWDRLVDLDLAVIQCLAGMFNISTPMVLSSSMGVSGDKQIRLIEMCQHLNADVFYEGESGQSYIEVDRFLKGGVRVVFQSYIHLVYKQLHGNFVSHLSALDLLFNAGPEEGLLILAGNTDPIRAAQNGS